MAVALDVANEVLSVFSRSNRTEMTLIELQSSLATRMTTDEVLRIIRLPNLVNLFNLQPISNNLCLIQLSPKVSRKFPLLLFIFFLLIIVNFSV